VGLMADWKQKDPEWNVPRDWGLEPNRTDS
jgi:hypothetical protein